MTNNQEKIDNFDQKMLQRCLNLARCALGKTSPNPLVGSVIVQDGKIVGEGFHPVAGAPHAEIFALKEAGELAKGATIYVSLEPCNHYGRTPPCTEAIIKAGITKVVIGTIDPDPRVSGEGVKRLQSAGIEVIIGVEESACRQLNEAFIYRVTHKKPFGTLKYAMTLDGKIATTTGHSSWVTGKNSRHLVHQVRAASDAIIIGGNTVRQDNPFLTTHNVADRNPLRVVMSRTLDLPAKAHLWDTTMAKTLVFTHRGANPAFQEVLLAQGVEVLELDSLTPNSVILQLYDRGFSSILWECGGVLAAQAIADGAIQKIMAFIAPKIIGGESAPSPVGDLGLEKMTDALLLDKVSIRTLGSDILIEGYL